jgi:hypothetical protein
VQPANSGVNKPFDRILKSFAEEAPGLFLRLLGLVPPGIEPDIQPLRPETAPPMVFPDYVAVVRIGSDDPMIFHAEFQSNYYLDLPRDMARYGGSLAWQHRIPVKSVLVMLRRDRAPLMIPGVGHYDIGLTHTEHPFKVLRLWEMDPAPVLETNNPKLLPWALLMKSSDEEVRKIASIVGSQDDDEAVGRFLTLGSIRYDRDALNEMVGGRKMGLRQAILDGKMMEVDRAKAAAEGRAEGEAQGQAQEARKFLRLLLRKRIPELESMPEIEAICDVEVLEAIIESVVDGSEAGPVRTAILAAVKAN